MLFDRVDLTFPGGIGEYWGNWHRWWKSQADTGAAVEHYLALAGEEDVVRSLPFQESCTSNLGFSQTFLEFWQCKKKCFYSRLVNKDRAVFGFWPLSVGCLLWCVFSYMLCCTHSVQFLGLLIAGTSHAKTLFTFLPQNLSAYVCRCFSAVLVALLGMHLSCSSGGLFLSVIDWIAPSLSTYLRGSLDSLGETSADACAQHIEQHTSCVGWTVILFLPKASAKLYFWGLFANGTPVQGSKKYYTPWWVLAALRSGGGL